MSFFSKTRIKATQLFEDSFEYLQRTYGQAVETFTPASPYGQILTVVSNLGELIFKLKVTKQSLNRVLRDLLKSRMIKQIQDDNDKRKKNIFLDKEGKVFFEIVYNTQKKRIFNALKNSNSDSVIKFKDVLKKIINGR